MATYTDNYQLTKPTYAEQADIGVINSNMNKIDNVMHSSQISLAPAYDQTKTYNKDDVVMYEMLMYKCKADNVTGNWDATKWERTTASECGASTKLIGVASGNPASFPDGSDNPLEACNVDINPVQDLHGYDKPWAGGAGKNILPMKLANIKSINTSGTWSGNVYTHNQIAFKVETDANDNIIGFTANGTALGQAIISLGTFTLEVGNYKTCANDATNIFYGTLRNGTTTAFIANIYNTDASLSVTDNTFLYLVTLVVPSGSTVNNTTIKPMIRIATEESSAFEPYTNICPITPRTEVNITVSATQGGSGEDTQIALGRNVYGGTLNVKTGELTVTHAITNVNSVITNRTTSYSNPVFYGEISGMKVGNQTITAEAFNGIASKLSAQNFANNSDNGDCTNNSNNTQFFIRADEYADVPTLKAALGTSQIVYELATPLTYTLTGEEVRSILGQNYIEADSGEITVAYVRDLNSCISNIISRIEALEQANSNRSFSLNRSFSKGVEEPQEEPSEEVEEEPKEEAKEEPEVKEEENNER